MSANFLEPQTDKMVQFLGPETDIILQFLAPEKVKMGQQNFWSQKLTKWVSFLGQKPYFMGEWNYIVKSIISPQFILQNAKKIHFPLYFFERVPS